jgi:hypothetical protein
VRTLILAFCFLAFTGISAIAQMYPSNTNFTRRTNSSVPSVYEGCLQRSSGGLLLTSSEGKNYYLVSGTVSLNGYIGQNVRIVANNINSADPSSGERGFGSGEPATGPLTLDVANISQAGNGCKSSAH